jgi:hypothetical protein
MAYYYFQIDGESTTFDIDTEAINFQLPDVERNIEKVDLFTDGSFIKGNSNFLSGEITFSKKITQSENDYTTWGALRNAVMRWLSLPKYKVLYFYIVDTLGASYRQRVYPISKGGESYTSIRISDECSFTFQMEKGYFEKFATTSRVKTLTTTTLELMSVNNAGALRVSPLFTFIPTANFNLFQIELAEGYGFRLETSFYIDDEITYDCATGIATINSSEITGILSYGSIFDLEPGNNTLYIYATTGALTVSYNERYI